jgi:hypothetical protein
MKTLIVIILALGIGFAAAYVVVSKQKDALLEQFKAQQTQLQANPVPAPVEKVIVAAASAPAEESPQDILNDLLNMKLGAGSERNVGSRMIVFKLESLAQRGKAAVPAIRAFLGRNVDVNYSVQDNSTNANNNRFGGPNNARRGGRFRRVQDLQTDWVVPPSLRLGLVGVLKEIDGGESEQALSEMLSTTARGVEVAYLARVLEGIAPGKYRDTAVAAAKELLMSPPSINSPDQLDDLSRPYLFGVLEMFNDTSFVPNAEQMLVGSDGRLDQDAMDYLSQVLKDQSVSALYTAYENQNLTNQFDKMNLGREIMAYVGQNAQANALFTETLNNAGLDDRIKAMTIAQLAGGGFGPFASQSPTDPQIIGPRIQLLNQFLSQPQFANNPQLLQAINATISALQGGSSVDMRQLMGGGRGGRGFGGGGGNNAAGQ